MYQGLNFRKISRSNTFLLKVMFVFLNYNEFKCLQRQIICQLFLQDDWVNHYIFRMINQRSMHMVLYVLSIFNLILIISRECFTIEKVVWSSCCQEGNTTRRFLPNLRREYLLMLTHTSIVVTKIV